MRSIRARFELDLRILSQLRFDSICARFELDSSIREKNEHVQFFPLSNRLELESSSNPLSAIAIRARYRARIRARIEHSRSRIESCSIFSQLSNRLELESSSNRESSVTIAIRFDMRSIRARFDSRTMSQLRFDSICARFELDSSIREFPILESSRNCDRVLESNRAHIELES